MVIIQFHYGRILRIFKQHSREVTSLVISPIFVFQISIVRIGNKLKDNFSEMIAQ